MIEIQDPPSAASELRRLRIEPRDPLHALPGGVSNRVYRAHTDSGDVVLKQSVERLMVAEEWLAPRERIFAEGAAMGIFHALAPERTPRLLATDPANYVIVMSAAPSNWTDWKSRLMHGAINPALGERIGGQLAGWHRATSQTVLPPTLTDTARLEELRLTPYFRTTGERRPQIASELDVVCDMLLHRRTCLVHGDFSPKNILTDGIDFWITDFEVSHLGDPRFDVGFLVSHLLLKAQAHPAHRVELRSTAAQFLAEYDRSALSPLTGDADLASITAALVAARIDGKSPVEYLSDGDKERLRDSTLSWLKNPESFWTDFKAEA